MFSYYGSKSKIAKLYPKPRYDRIIEPFAGSARYSLLYPEREVILIDRDPTICRIWDWLINECTISDIDNLPDLKLGDDLRKIKWLSQVERDLLGFCVGPGRPQPCYVVTTRGEGIDGRDTQINRLKIRMRLYIPKIKHWRILNQSYNEYEDNQESTWFIDPPYKGKGGNTYVYRSINYKELSQWCLSRNGQVIVCEGVKGDWLPFRDLYIGGYRGSHRILREKIWTNTPIKIPAYANGPIRSSLA